MKKNLFKSLIIAAMAAICTSCSFADYEYRDNAPGLYITGPYIQNYYDGELLLNTVNDPSGGLPIVSVTINGDESLKLYSAASYPAVYDSLCTKHADTTFNGKDLYFSNPAKLCFAHDLSSIDFVCDKAFDAAHPAGTSLLDIMNYSATSLSRWIKKGYPMDTYENDYLILNKKADTLEPDDMSLLCYFNIFQLQFASAPDVSGIYNFALTITCDDGTVKTLSVRIVF